MEVCLEKAKASLKEIKAAMDVFEEGMNQMHTTGLEASGQRTEAVAVLQEEALTENFGALEDSCGGQHNHRTLLTAEETDH
jgi:hypothetical protein